MNQTKAIAVDQHYTVAEVAELLNVHEMTLAVTKTADSEREVKMGFLSSLLQRYAQGTHDPEEFVFSVKTEKGTCRDDHGIRRYFITPVA